MKLLDLLCIAPYILTSCAHSHWQSNQWLPFKRELYVLRGMVQSHSTGCISSLISGHSVTLIYIDIVVLVRLTTLSWCFVQIVDSTCKLTKTKVVKNMGLFCADHSLSHTHTHNHTHTHTMTVTYTHEHPYSHTHTHNHTCLPWQSTQTCVHMRAHTHNEAVILHITKTSLYLYLKIIFFQKNKLTWIWTEIIILLTPCKRQDN